MPLYRRLFLVVIIGLALSCTFAPDMQESYWPCGPGDVCPSDCKCLDGEVCIPEKEDLTPIDCQWCAYGHKDCDVDPKNGCEVNWLADSQNCGDCGVVCPTDWLCERGTCVPGCRSDLVQCDEGCVDTQSDPNNCGDCGNTCKLNQVCDLGVCTDVCGKGRIDCYGSCAELETDPSNCGECGIVCDSLNAHPKCELGMCQVGECIHPFGDCDRLKEGCETDLKTTVTDCGSCGNACGINMRCLGGACQCNEYFADCDENRDTGCEIRIKTDPLHCGECGNVCDQPPLDFCEENLLMVHPRLGACDEWTCWYEPTPTTCEFGCFNGECMGDPCEEVTCDESEVCVDGACACGGTGPDCHSDQTCCGTECVDTWIESDHCGFCFNKCGDHGHCTGGLCYCDELWGDCNYSQADGCETMLYESAEHCGSCGNSCGQNADCISSWCACQEGFNNCDGVWDNGCEVDLSSPDTCGGCYTACTTGESCCGGACTDISQDDSNCGFCGNDCSTGDICCDAGCVNTSTSITHCGQCFNTCVGNKPCNQGSCGSVGVDCGGTFCDPFQGQMCCYSSAGGMGCNTTNDCTDHMFDCDGPEDCDAGYICCAVMAAAEASSCMLAQNCPNTILCSSDLQCKEYNPDAGFCCPESIMGVDIFVCMSACP